MSAAPLQERDLDELAIFPLHGVALFPNTVVPLHVFEPRYRQLVQDCIERERPLAVWQLDPAQPASDFGPGIRRVATAGRIAVHHEMPDGRFNVVVEGLERVRLVEELDAPLSVTDLFQYATVEALARRLESGQGTAGATAPDPADAESGPALRCQWMVQDSMTSSAPAVLSTVMVMPTGFA